MKHGVLVGPLPDDVIRDYGHADHVGKGVSGVILRRTKKHNGSEPDFIEEEDCFTVQVWKDARS